MNKFYFDRPEARQKIVEIMSGNHPENWQKTLTPSEIIQAMVALVQDSPELLYVVLFNLEFLEELCVRGIAPERIVFVAGNQFKAAVSMSVYGVKSFP